MAYRFVRSHKWRRGIFLLRLSCIQMKMDILLADFIAKDYTGRSKIFDLELLVELLLDFQGLRLYPEKVTQHREER